MLALRESHASPCHCLAALFSDQPFSTPVVCVALPSCIQLTTQYAPSFAQFSRAILFAGELLTLIVGAGASAYTLARSEGGPPYGPWILAFGLLFLVFYGVLFVGVIASFF